MPFGVSFGSKSSSSSTDFDKTGVQNQTGTTAQNQTKTGSSATNTSQTGSSATTGKTVDAGTNKTTTTGTQNQVATSTAFSDQILQALESAGLGALNSVTGGAINTSALSGFDANAYVADAVARAEAAGRDTIDIGSSGLADSIGGTASGNSMAALLQQRLQQDAAAGVQGARADAVSTAQGIVRSNLETQMAGRGQEVGLVESLLGQLKGGAQTTTAAGTTTGTSDQQTQNTGASSQNQATASSSATSTQTVDQLIGLISELVSGTTRETGRENTNESSGGGGFSLGF